MNNMDFSFFFEPPEYTASGLLQIEALAPLSMASGHPGNYYQSLRSPSPHMLFGMLENALGWHFAEDIRKALFKQLQKDAKKANKKDAKSSWLTAQPEMSDSKYFSFLQYHLEFEPSIFEPDTLTYDDLWSQLLRDSGRSFFGGSRHYDASLETTINRVRNKEIEFGDRAEYKDVQATDFDNLQEGAKVNYRSIRDLFPQYYASLPTVREYVEPTRINKKVGDPDYLFRFNTTPKVLDLLTEALENPAAPLYLGSNDGWVHATIEKI
ncbi:hypothetical protein [Pontibacter rugosus]|uniref:CRISPR-associated protein Cas5 n=1 Tax=Pontibacter rugosus TaxID=1745966 RepID=A0ABW3SRH7_9BACT